MGEDKLSRAFSLSWSAAVWKREQHSRRVVHAIQQFLSTVRRVLQKKLLGDWERDVDAEAKAFAVARQ